MPVSLTVPLQAFVATIISDYELEMRAGTIFWGVCGFTPGQQKKIFKFVCFKWPILTGMTAKYGIYLYFLCQQEGDFPLSSWVGGGGGSDPPTQLQRRSLNPPPPPPNAGFCSQVCPDAEVIGLFIAIIVHHNWFTKQTIINYNFLTQSSLKFTLKLGVSIAKVF